jgi:rSAM/selenodomain-associated transferase 1
MESPTEKMRSRYVLPTISLSETEEKIMLFTRYPAPGQAKTRLMPALGARGAAALQRRLTEQTVARIRTLQSRRPVRFEIRYTGGNRKLFRKWLHGEDLISQGENGLGDRLRRAFAAAFAQGYRRVVAIGADCPSLSPEVLTGAFEELRHRDLVLGPAEDGGYYLLGLSRRAPALFVDIPWGTSSVLAVTAARAEANALSVSLLEPLADVDRPEDLIHLDYHPRP